MKIEQEKQHILQLVK